MSSLTSGCSEAPCVPGATSVARWSPLLRASVGTIRTDWTKPRCAVGAAGMENTPVAGSEASKEGTLAHPYVACSCHALCYRSLRLNTPARCAVFCSPPAPGLQSQKSSSSPHPKRRLARLPPQANAPAERKKTLCLGVHRKAEPKPAEHKRRN